jgi:hypothetical protein
MARDYPELKPASHAHSDMALVRQNFGTQHGSNPGVVQTGGVGEDV